MIVDDWARWESSWRREGAVSPSPDALFAHARAGRRSLLAIRVASLAIAVLSLVAVGLALWHAANAAEAMLGFGVGIAIAVTWVRYAWERDRAVDVDLAPPAQFIALRRALSERQIRFARFGWIVAALELMFLVPWWIGGISVHGWGFSPLRIGSFYAPVAAIIAFVVWTVITNRRATRELALLRRVEAQNAER